MELCDCFRYYSLVGGVRSWHLVNLVKIKNTKKGRIKKMKKPAFFSATRYRLTRTPFLHKTTRYSRLYDYVVYINHTSHGTRTRLVDFGKPCKLQKGATVC